MARLINCKDCKKLNTDLALEYDEIYETVEGKAKNDFLCDTCGADIPQGKTCCAAVLLPKNHPAYEDQKPQMWAKEFIL